MRSVEVGKMYLTKFMNQEIEVTLVKIIPSSGRAGDANWDMSCICEANGIELLRRISELNVVT